MILCRMKALVVLLAAWSVAAAEEAQVLEDMPPIISINLPVMGELEKVMAHKNLGLCHETAQWETMLYGGESSFTPPVCGTTTGQKYEIYAKRCEVLNANVANCPEPTAMAFDHHEGRMDDRIFIKKTLFVQSDPGGALSCPSHCGVPVGGTRTCDKKPFPSRCVIYNGLANADNIPAINYNQRGEYLLTYDAQDGSGNDAETLRFAMILEDTEAPMLNAGIILPTTIEAGQSSWAQFYVLPDGSALDNYDQNVTETVTISMTDPSAQTSAGEQLDTLLLGEHTATYTAHDWASLFGKDNKDNVAVQEYKVTVQDTLPPSVLCKTGNAVTCSIAVVGGVSQLQCTGAYPCNSTEVRASSTIECGQSYSDFGAVCVDMHDSWDGSAIDVTKVVALNHGGLNTTQYGAHNIVYSCTDGAQNSATATRALSVSDSTAPVLSLKDDSDMNLVIEEFCGTVVETEVKRAMQRDVGYMVEDACGNSEIQCTFKMYIGNCVGSFTCMNPVTNDWSEECTGPPEFDSNGTSREIEFDKVYEEHWAAPGTYGLKYTCSDEQGHATAKCRTVIVKATPACTQVHPTPAPCVLIPGSTWESKAETYTTPRVCSNCDVCDDNEWMQQDCGEWNDRVCMECQSCDSSYAFPTQNCTETIPAVCQNHTICDANQYECRAAAKYEDRECCQTTQPCPVGEYMTSPGTAFTDTVCEDHTSCDKLEPFEHFEQCTGNVPITTFSEFSSRGTSSGCEARGTDLRDQWGSDCIWTSQIVAINKNQFTHVDADFSAAKYGNMSASDFMKIAIRFRNGDTWSDYLTMQNLNGNFGEWQWRTYQADETPAGSADAFQVLVHLRSDVELWERHAFDELKLWGVCSTADPMKMERVEYETVAATPTSDRQCTGLTYCEAVIEYEAAAPTATSDRVCDSVTECNEFQYEIIHPTRSSNRQCLDMTDCTYAVEYQFKAPTRTSDRECKLITNCIPDVQYAERDFSAHHDRICKNITTCTSIEFENSPPTYTSDRVCQEHHECLGTYDHFPFMVHHEYELVAPTLTTDRVCAQVSECADGQFESVAPTVTSDRICGTNGMCQVEQYEYTPPTSTSARQCQELTPCTPNQYEFTAPTATSDRGCTFHSQCTGEEYMAQTGGAYADAVCHLLNVCNVTAEFEKIAPTATSQRICQEHSVCDVRYSANSSIPVRHQYEISPPSPVADRVCVAVSVCGGTQYEEQPPTVSADRLCLSISHCLATEYELNAPSLDSDRVCHALTVCTSTQYEASPPFDALHGPNRVCKPYSTCSFPAQWESRAATSTSDKICAIVSNCTGTQVVHTTATPNSDTICSSQEPCTASQYNVGVDPVTNHNLCEALRVCAVDEWESHGPSFLNGQNMDNRICETLTICGAEQYEVAAPTSISDRNCADSSICTVGQYESIAPTVNSDRTCTQLSVCDYATTYQSQLPTPTSNRICTTLTNCGLEHYQSVAPSTVSDRACHPATICTAAQFESEPLTDTLDRVCTDASVCPAGQIMAASHTAVSDTVCHATGECTAAQYETQPPTATSDRACAAVTPCDHSQYYTAAVATTTSNTVCAILHLCNADQYESVPPTIYTNRQCQIYTTCRHALEYEDSAGTPFADRVCMDLSMCDYETEYESAVPTPYSDRLCRGLTACGAGHYEITAPTHTTDRICQLERACTAEEFETLPPTASADRVCQAAQLCDTATQYVQTAATATSDTVCASTGMCSATQYEIQPGPPRLCAGLRNCLSETEFIATDPTPTSDRVCTSHTECSQIHFEVTAPSATSDRTCAHLTAPCEYTTQYESVAPTAVSDRQCQSLTICTSVEYETVEATESSDRACTVAQVCDATQYESSPRTATSDRVCSLLKDCTADEYEYIAPTPVADRVCRALVTCSASEYQVTPPSVSADRVCNAHSICQAGQFEQNPPTATTDRHCVAVSQCPVGQYIYTPSTATSDVTCATTGLCCDIFNTQPACQGEAANSQYQSAAPTQTTPRMCSALTLCLANEYEKEAPTAVSNRVCSPLAVCDHTLQYESIPPTTTSDRRCSNQHTCLQGQYEKIPPTSTSDRVCQTLTPCNSDSQFELHAATATSDRVCENLKVCLDTEYQSMPPTLTSDRQCTTLTVCLNDHGHLGKCHYDIYDVYSDADGNGNLSPVVCQFESVIPTETSDRECSGLTTCLATEYQSVPNSDSSDRVCSPMTVCTNTQFQQQAPSQSSDRICTAATVCPVGQEEYAPPTATSDRTCKTIEGSCNSDQYMVQEFVPPHTPTVCVALSICTAAQYETIAPTTTSNRVCTGLLICSGMEFETVASTATSDRSCTLITHCTHDVTYRTVQQTPTSDATCAPLTQCTDEEWESKSPTVLADRVCNALTTCYDNEYESQEPSTTSDRVCVPLTLCHPINQYFTIPHTATSDRTCVEYTICTIGVSFETTPQSASSDRVCAPVTACHANQYTIAEATLTSNIICGSLTACAADQYEYQAATNDRDRQCIGFTQCDHTAQYESVAPEPTSDRQCSPLTVCTGFQWETTAPSETTDRHCAELKICSDTEFELIAPTAVANRICAILHDCVYSAQYEFQEPTSTSNRICHALTQCNIADEYEITQPTASSDRICKKLTICVNVEQEYRYVDGFSYLVDKYQDHSHAEHTQNQFETVSPTPTSDRECTPVTSCVADHYEVLAPTTTSNRVCAPVTTCTVTEFESVLPTATSDRVCHDVSVCPNNQFQLTSATPTSDVTCATAGICELDQYEVEPKTLTSDRVCQALTTCSEVQFESTLPTASSNRICTMLTICEPTTHYQLTLPTLTSDRVCQLSTVCQTDSWVDQQTMHDYAARYTGVDLNDNGEPVSDQQQAEYISELATPTSDNVCTAVSTCVDGHQYQAVPPTHTSDRICADATVCSNMQFEFQDLTLTSDRICNGLTICTENQYEFLQPTTRDNLCHNQGLARFYRNVETFIYETDRVCADIRPPCPVDTHYEIYPPTAISDRICTVATVCDHSIEYEHTALTPTGDRACFSHSTCTASQFIVLEPTATSDRVCQEIRVCHACNLGDLCPKAEVWEFESAAPTSSSNRVCEAATVCKRETSIPGAGMCLESNAEGTILYYEQCYVSEHQAFEWRPTLMEGQGPVVGKSTDALQTSTWEKGSHDQPIGFLYLPVLDKCLKQHGESLVMADCRADLADMKFYRNEHGQIYRGDDAACIERKVLGGIFAGVNHQAVEDMFMGVSNLLAGTTDMSKCTELSSLAPYIFEMPAEATDGAPVINLRGAENIYLRTNNQMEYVDAGASCSDLSDGSINDRVTVTGDIVDIHTPGTYVTFYNCMNEAGAAAKEMSRTVHVVRLIEEYAIVPLTPTSDRTCKAATTCSIHQYQSIAMSGKSDRVCSPLGTCPSGHYTYKVPTWTSDRICKATTACKDGFYELYKATDTSDRKCVRLTECYPYNGVFVASREYESVVSTPTSDRVCTLLTTCTASEYESEFPTKTSDRKCLLIQDCQDKTPPEFESAPPSTTSDKTCSPYTTCDAVREYENRVPTATSDRGCTRLTSCNALDNYCFEASSDGSKLYYEQCTNSDLQAFEWRPTVMADGTPFDVNSATAWEKDNAGNQVGVLYLPILAKCLHNTGTAIELATCEDSDQMKFYLDEFKQILQKSGTDPRGCFKEQMITHSVYETEIISSEQAMQDCTRWTGLTSYLFVVPDMSKENQKPVINIKGAALLTLASDEHGEYEDLGAECHDFTDGDLTTETLTVTGDVVKMDIPQGPAVYTVEYQCVNHQGVHATPVQRIVTVITLQYETTSPTPTSNRVCSSASPCSRGQYETSPPAGTVDRTCASVTICIADQEWEAVAPTATSDATCEPVTQCSGDEYQASPPTPMADATCAPHTQCIVPCNTEFELQKPTLTSDRVCKKSTQCTAFEYEAEACSPVKDKVCRLLTVCPNHQYTSKFPTTTSDRVCADRPAPVITILGGQIITLEAERDCASNPTCAFSDPGARCVEVDDDGLEINLNVKTTGAAYFNILSPPAQIITYTCASSFTGVESEKNRTVTVHDTKCPTCTLKNPETLVTIEASFPYADTGVQCQDNFSPNTTVTETSNVNVEAVGTYHVTYRAEDEAGNFNDGSSRQSFTQLGSTNNHTCSGGALKELVRTVVVIDTLRPVIALKYKDQIIGHSNSQDHSSTLSSWRNPASHYFFAKNGPRAEDNFIEDYSFKFERGSSPYILPTTPGQPEYNVNNPNNLQATIETCKDQCKTIAGCKYGTFITDTNSSRSGECWLSAQTSADDRLCGVSCQSFDKVSYDHTTGGLMATIRQRHPSRIMLSMLSAIALMVVGIAFSRRQIDSGDLIQLTGETMYLRTPSKEASYDESLCV